MASPEWQVGDVVLAHDWVGKNARWNGWAVKIVGELAKRKVRSPLSGAEYDLTTYCVQPPEGPTICAAPVNLRPLEPPDPTKRDDLKIEEWRPCWYKPPHLRGK